MNHAKKCNVKIPPGNYTLLRYIYMKVKQVYID